MVPSSRTRLSASPFYSLSYEAANPWCATAETQVNNEHKERKGVREGVEGSEDRRGRVEERGRRYRRGGRGRREGGGRLEESGRGTEVGVEERERERERERR